MADYRVAVIRGDGIGPEVVEEGLKAMRAVAQVCGVSLEFVEFPWGAAYYFEHGNMMPSDALDTLSGFDAIYLGAVGHPEIQDHITLNGLLLPIRRTFDQYVCQRPSVLYSGVESPLRGIGPGDIDMVVIRENTEGEYADIGGFQYSGFPEEVGVQTSLFTRRGCQRTMAHAFNLARERGGKKHVTSVTKSNAQGYGMVLWDTVFQEVARGYPDIETQSLLVDAACMDFVRQPQAFDVVVASNLFGDILTDLGAVITGSMGLAPSGNIDPERRFPSMFEPVHGSAPDITGKGVANPLGAVLSGGMMLRHLGETAAADAVEGSVMAVLKESRTLTPDLGGTATTAEVGDEVIAALGQG